VTAKSLCLPKAVSAWKSLSPGELRGQRSGRVELDPDHLWDCHVILSDEA
jgi:hypothetical protein